MRGGAPKRPVRSGVRNGPSVVSGSLVRTLCFLIGLVILWSVTIVLFFSIDYSSTSTPDKTAQKAAVATREGDSYKPLLRASDVESNDLLAVAVAEHEATAAAPTPPTVAPLIATPPGPAPVPTGGNKAPIPIIIFTHARAQYLDRCLKTLYKYWPGVEQFPIFISQDGDDFDVTRIIKEHADRAEHWRHVPSADGAGPGENPSYYKIAQHYGWALKKVFDDPSGYQQVIMLEEDLSVSPDFFDYFRATLPLLDQDPTLMAVSAWNDNGMDMLVEDPQALYRSDFFPGLGWMMPRRIWNEWGGKWTKGYWDDWVREPAQRKGRAVIRPEISRTFTFGETGVSGGQFYSSHLKNIVLNEVPVPWTQLDLSYLMKDKYDQLLKNEIAAAPETDFSSYAKDHTEKTLKYVYESEGDFRQMANRMGLMDDTKAGVPRTAYMGVVAVKFKSHKILFVPRSFPAVNYQQ